MPLNSEPAIRYAMGFLHTPYAYGGNGAYFTNLGESRFGGFDCSGFVIEVLQAFGAVGRGDWTAQGLYVELKRRYRSTFNEGLTRALGCESEGKIAEMHLAGEVLFFGKDVANISHVALAVNTWQMIEAGGGDKRCITQGLSTGFVRLRPIAYRKDLVAGIMPEWRPTNS